MLSLHDQVLQLASSTHHLRQRWLEAYSMNQAIQSLSQVAADRLNSLNYSLESLENLCTVLLQASAKSQDTATDIFHGCTTSGEPKGSGSWTDGESQEHHTAQASNRTDQTSAPAAPTAVKSPPQSSLAEAMVTIFPEVTTPRRSRRFKGRSKSLRSLAAAQAGRKTLTGSRSSQRRGR